MNFNIKKFKNNILFFVICAVLIVFLSLLSFLADRSASYLDEEDLGDGDVNIGKLVLNEIMKKYK